MEENTSSKWTSGIILSAIGIVWGVSSLVSGRLVIPFLGWHGIPLTNDIPLQGVPAILLSVALIWFGLYLHFSDFWSCYPGAVRFTKFAEPLTGWAATICFVAGIVIWIFR
jgi:sulfite exporter TauE/SafE